MKIEKNRWLLLIFCVFLLSGCSEGEEGYVDVEPSNVYPVPGSKNVYPEGEFMLVFDNVPTMEDGSFIKIYEVGNFDPVDEIRIFPKRTGFQNPASSSDPNYNTPWLAEDKGTVQLFPNSSISGTDAARPQDKPGFRGIHQAFTRTWVTEKDKRTLKLDPVKSTTLYITPSHGALQYGRTYRVEIEYGLITDTDLDGKYFFGFYKGSPQGEWTFTTRGAPSVSNPITVDGSMHTGSKADFRTIWAALAWVRSAPVGNYTINVAPGVYNEMINYHEPSSEKSITINGTGSAKYGADVVIQWLNHTHINGGSGSTHWRSVVYFSGPRNIVLKNITMKNLDEHSGGQAEVLMFGNGSATGATNSNRDARAVYNCGFYGHQDTLNTSGRCWFYQCYIEGDTDFIWGGSDVTLIEECELKVILCGTNLSRGGYPFASRVSNTVTDAAGNQVASKGYILFNSVLSNESNGSAYFGRTQADATRWDQAAVIDTVIGPGNFQSSLWNVSTEVGFINNGEDVGYKVYNLTRPDETAYPVSGKHARTSIMTNILYNAEYSHRNLILNRVYNTVTQTYQPARFVWDISGLEADFAAGQ